MAAVTITTEELECRDILNDVGIFFSGDLGIFDSESPDRADEIKPIIVTAASAISSYSKSLHPVSPIPTPEIPASMASFDALNLLEPIQTEITFRKDQQRKLVPVLPYIAPKMSVPTTIPPCAVSDASIKATKISQMSSTRKRLIKSENRSVLKDALDHDEQVRR